MATASGKKQKSVAHTLKWPSGLVCLVNCINLVKIAKPDPVISKFYLGQQRSILLHPSFLNEVMEGFWRVRVQGEETNSLLVISEIYKKDTTLELHCMFNTCKILMAKHLEIV